MKKAIITGASGFIGYALLKELLQNDYEVLAVVHTEAGMEKIRYLNNQWAYPVLCELSNYDSLFQVASGSYDIFFHMAWEGVSGEKSKDIFIQNKNIYGAVQAVRIAQKLNCKRFLGAGSLHEIECMREMEQQNKSLNLGNYYKTAKLTAHYYCKLEVSQGNMDFLWPRLTNAYGVGEKSVRLINSFIHKLLMGESPEVTEATQLYNFIYITDAARAYRLIAERGRSYANYILGSEEVRPLKDYLIKIKDLVNPSVPIGFGKYPYRGIYLEKSDLYCSSFFSDTGFKTEISFVEGILLVKEYIKTGQKWNNMETGG